MSETFKQKVEEILECSDLGVLVKCPYPEHEVKYSGCTECQVARILAAYKEAVEGMPLFTDDNFRHTGNTAQKQLEACKEHMMKEMGE